MAAIKTAERPIHESGLITAAFKCDNGVRWWAQEGRKTKERAGVEEATSGSMAG